MWLTSEEYKNAFKLHAFFNISYTYIMKNELLKQTEYHLFLSVFYKKHNKAKPSLGPVFSNRNVKKTLIT